MCRISLTWHGPDLQLSGMHPEVDPKIVARADISNPGRILKSSSTLEGTFELDGDLPELPDGEVWRQAAIIQVQLNHVGIACKVLWSSSLSRLCVQSRSANTSLTTQWRTSRCANVNFSAIRRTDVAKQTDKLLRTNCASRNFENEALETLSNRSIWITVISSLSFRINLRWHPIAVLSVASIRNLKSVLTTSRRWRRSPPKLSNSSVQGFLIDLRSPSTVFPLWTHRVWMSSLHCARCPLETYRIFVIRIFFMIRIVWKRRTRKQATSASVLFSWLNELIVLLDVDEEEVELVRYHVEDIVPRSEPDLGHNTREVVPTCPAIGVPVSNVRPRNGVRQFLGWYPRSALHSASWFVLCITLTQYGGSVTPLTLFVSVTVTQWWGSVTLILRGPSPWLLVKRQSGQKLSLKADPQLQTCNMHRPLSSFLNPEGSGTLMLFNAYAMNSCRLGPIRKGKFRERLDSVHLDETLVLFMQVVAFYWNPAEMSSNALSTTTRNEHLSNANWRRNHIRSVREIVLTIM